MHTHIHTYIDVAFKTVLLQVTYEHITHRLYLQNVANYFIL